MTANFDINDIKSSTDIKSFERALGLYNAGKVTKFSEVEKGYIASVQGTQKYNVFVRKEDPMSGDCNCYLGQQEIYCKHMIAVGLYAIKKGHILTQEEQRFHDCMSCSGIIGDLSENEWKETKAEISRAMKYIKYYDGPSSKRFQYQDSLQKGCSLLGMIFSQLPISLKNAELIIKTLLKIDKKLMHGIDDSNGIVGGCIEESVSLLEEFIQKNKKCVNACKLLKNKETSFGWEKPLLKLF